MNELANKAGKRILRRIRQSIAVFVAGLVISGLTAFPLQTELEKLRFFLHANLLSSIPGIPELTRWIDLVTIALRETNARYPFLAYGTDWLAFAHLVIAIAFFGPYRDPVRNSWVITFGLIACACVLPLALVAGEVRGIPVAWRILDCSFGVCGAIPLLYCRLLITKLEQLPTTSEDVRRTSYATDQRARDSF
jgi:hypothetical protein